MCPASDDNILFYCLNCEVAYAKMFLNMILVN